MRNACKFEIIKMQPEFTNSVLVSDGVNAIIFDPWGHYDDWKKLLSERGLNLCAVYSTHGHPDHIAAAPFFDVPWYMNNGDTDYITGADRWLGIYGMPRFPKNYKQPINLIAGNIDVLGATTQVIMTPGHSRGGVVFYFPDAKILITGDTIFSDTVGRYDLPGGDYDVLLKSVKKIHDMNLPDDTIVVPGHGAQSTIGEMNKNNPYFNNG